LGNEEGLTHVMLGPSRECLSFILVFVTVVIFILSVTLLFLLLLLLSWWEAVSLLLILMLVLFFRFTLAVSKSTQTATYWDTYQYRGLQWRQY